MRFCAELGILVQAQVSTAVILPYLQQLSRGALDGWAWLSRKSSDRWSDLRGEW
jgi:hypothetical protein